MISYHFYFVGTPIGNLRDLSSRAVDVFRSVDLILAEDTRKARVLMGHYGISTPVRSYHDHNKIRVTPSIIKKIEAGQRIALVSDAGTPMISDPGYYLARRLIDKGIEITSVPGASAVLDALVVSGLPPDRFTFFGYVPRKAGVRDRVLHEAAENPGTSIFFESPRRLVKTLEEADRILGERELVVARELTKMHEEVLRGTARELIERFKGRGVKGEITLLIRGVGRRTGGTA